MFGTGIARMRTALRDLLARTDSSSPSMINVFVYLVIVSFKILIVVELQVGGCVVDIALL